MYPMLHGATSFNQNAEESTLIVAKLLIQPEFENFQLKGRSVFSLILSKFLPMTIERSAKNKLIITFSSSVDNYGNLLKSFSRG